jgi:site-specific DNA-methyltransferase (adenine-specific)
LNDVVCGDCLVEMAKMEPNSIDALVTDPPNGLILDPFCGSGSTLIAAKQEGFRYIGIDISEEYCEIARKRIDGT